MKKNEVLETVRRELEFWEGTNDITSPTHYTDIDEFVKLLELDPEAEQLLIDGLTNILRAYKMSLD